MRFFNFLILLVVSGNNSSAEKSDETLLITNVAQLTFEGNRSGEGYFSKSGNKICFQAENHPGNPFYQIYVLDLLNGQTKLVSNGNGKTTCAWFGPSENKILYASTHRDLKALEKQKEELDLRKSGKNRKYNWDYDSSYDLFIKDLRNNTEIQITNDEGYDAECAFSPDGKKVVFTSNRHYYSDKSHNKENSKNFMPSFFNEIYLMDSDGSNTKRLTNHDGYDGGPFFDATGEYICWRRFSSDGHKAEIFRMSSDGKDQTQITELNAMSWAPFFHPSNKYIIFTTNLHGFQNFELYIVDFDGKKEPVRVTYREGFDGLPTFSPDGKTISWTSNQTPTKKSQIFIADWDHEKALELIESAESSNRVDSILEASSNDEKDVEGHLRFLTSEELEGRSTGSNGIKMANKYVADHFAKSKLSPCFDKSWHQDFSFYKFASIAEKSFLQINKNNESLILNEGWTPLAFSESGSASINEITFVGYGLILTEEKNGLSYDSYTHLDVKDKWVMCLRGLPPKWKDKEKERNYYNSTLRKKASVARDLGAAGIIFVHDHNSTEQEVVPFESSTREKISIQAISLNNKARNKIFERAGKDFTKTSNSFETGEQRMGFVLDKISLDSSIQIIRHKGICQNTVGFLDLNKNGKLDYPFILIGAHLDHIGRGKQSSRAKKSDIGKIHPGADDNGSGISALLEIIRTLTKNKNSLKDSKYEIAFATWSGEEIGLVGSSHFANELFGNRKDKGKQLIAAYLNMDMVGRLRDKMTIHGVGSSTVWRKIIQQANVPIRLNLNLQNDSHIPTDTTSFYSKGVPIISAFTGLHNDYHSPTDTVDKINFEGIKKCSALFSRIVTLLAHTDDIDYISQKRPTKNNRAKLRAYLGTIPNYSQTDAKGVLLSGVSNSGPADIAGMQSGDLIIKLGKKNIENIYDYTEAISALVPGQKVSVIVLREGITKSLSIIPKAR
ncbi:MAG: M28 family peptidase [Verrucomicrobiota bacterium]|nr:M28 family peptidase [Verrucomicrobiota bacterium]